MIGCDIKTAIRNTTDYTNEFIKVADSYTGSDPTNLLTQKWKNWYNAVKNRLGSTITIEGLSKELKNPTKQNEFMEAYNFYRAELKPLNVGADSIEEAAHKFAATYHSLKNYWEDTNVWDDIVKKAIKTTKKENSGMLHAIEGGFLNDLMKNTQTQDRYDDIMESFTYKNSREHVISKLSSDNPNALFQTTRIFDRFARALNSVWSLVWDKANALLPIQQGASYLSALMSKRWTRDGATVLNESLGLWRKATDFDNNGGTSIGWWINGFIAANQRRLAAMIPGFDEGLTTAENLERLKKTNWGAKAMDVIVNSVPYKMLSNVRNNYGDVTDFVGNQFFEKEAMNIIMDTSGISEVEARLFNQLPVQRQQQIADTVREQYDLVVQGLNGAARSMSASKASSYFEIATMLTMYMGQYWFLNTKNLFRLGNNYFNAFSKMITGDYAAAKKMLVDPLYVSMVRQLIWEVNVSSKMNRTRREDDEELTRGQTVARTMDSAASVGRYLQAPSLFSYGRIALWLQGFNSTEFTDQRAKDAASYKLSKSIASELARQFQSLRFWDIANWDIQKYIDWLVGNKVATRLRLTLPVEDETYGLLEDYMWGNYLNYFAGFDQPNTESYYYKKVLEKGLEGKNILQMLMHTETRGWQKKYFVPGEFEAKYQSITDYTNDTMRQINEEGIATVLRNKPASVRKGMYDVGYQTVIGTPSEALGKGINEITYDDDNNIIIEDNVEGTVDLQLLKNLNEESVNGVKLFLNKEGGLQRYLDVMWAYTYGNFSDGTKVYSTSKQKTALSQYAELMAMMDSGLDENYWPANYQMNQLMARVTDSKIKKGEIAIHRNGDETWTITELPTGKKGYYSSDGVLIIKEKGNAIMKNDDVRKQFIVEKFLDPLLNIAPITKPEMVINLAALEGKQYGIDDVLTPKYTTKGDYSGYEFTSDWYKIQNYIRANQNTENAVLAWDDPLEAVKGLNIAIREQVYIPPEKWETQQQTSDRLKQQAKWTLSLVSFASDRLSKLQWDPEIKAMAMVKLLDSNMSVMDYYSDESEAGRLSTEDQLFWEDYVTKHLFKAAADIEWGLTSADIAAKIGNTRWAVGWAGGAWGGKKGKKAPNVKIADASLIGIAETMEKLQKRYVNSNTGFSFPEINLPPIKIPDGTKVFGKAYFAAVGNAITNQPTAAKQWWSGIKSRVFTIAEPKPSKSLKARIASRKKATRKSA